MRSPEPFFNGVDTTESIEATATAEGRLVLYCGAGVTIDRTGHSWASLVRSLLPERRHTTRPNVPTRAQVEKLRRDSPESLASSVVHVLRREHGGGEPLQRALRDRLRKSLYKTQSRWQAGALVNELFTLALVRSAFARDTRFLTTNYDTHLERDYDAYRSNVDAGPQIPGLRVYIAGIAQPVRLEQPQSMDPDNPGSFIDIVYLHGRLPDVGGGNASWPLVLDERSYASSAQRVEAVIEDELRNASLAIMLGTSLTDTPLVRALSNTAGPGCSRIALLLRADFAHDDDADEQLALDLAKHRVATLRVSPLFPDFPLQAAQLMREVSLRMAFPIARPDEVHTLPYTERVDAWWSRWHVHRGSDVGVVDELRDTLAVAYDIIGVRPPATPVEPPTEQLQVELWVRQAPIRTNRDLRRWARSSELTPAGFSGKVARLEHGSYLAPVRAFIEGRPLRLAVEELEEGRHSFARYTWKTFLCVPIRVNAAVVGVISLASDRAIDTTSLARDDNTTEALVQLMRSNGVELLSA